MDNSTNSTAGLPRPSALSVGGYLTLDLISLVLISPLELILNTLVLVAFSLNKEFKRSAPQRTIHLNILVAGLVSSVSVIFIAASYAVIVTGNSSTGGILCAIFFYLSYLGFGMNNILLASLAVTLYIVIRCGVEKVKTVHLNVSIIIIWIIMAILPIPYFTPIYDFSQPFDGAICIPMFQPGSYAHVIISAVVTDIFSRIISVIVVIALLVYIRKNTFSSDFRLKKAMVKFTGLLLLENFLRFLLSLLGILGIAGESLLGVTGIVILNYFNLFVTSRLPILIPPILIIVLYKPIRRTMKGILCCKLEYIVNSTTTIVTRNSKTN